MLKPCIHSLPRENGGEGDKESQKSFRGGKKEREPGINASSLLMAFGVTQTEDPLEVFYR
jgi:hypothetical protein